MKRGRLQRREALRFAAIGGMTLAAGTLAGWRALAQVVVKEIHELQPGEFTWQPERSPIGPVAIVVSIPDQRVHVYRNGIRIAVSTCSTGKPGHVTPTGVFTVLQKDKHHRSSTYVGAPMPNMNRLTWDGVALHAGDLPGYLFILIDTHDARRGLTWQAIGHHPKQASGFREPDEAVIRRLRADEPILEAMKARIHPGMVLVMTDLPAHADTRSGTDFVIMSPDAG